MTHVHTDTYGHNPGEWVYIDPVEQAYHLYTWAPFHQEYACPPDPPYMRTGKDRYKSEVRLTWEETYRSVRTERRMETCTHDHIIDCSSAGPDSGNMDHMCAVCGRYWSVSLY